MFYFNKEQKIEDIGGIKFGGQPRENPTVLIGGIKKITPLNQEQVKENITVQNELSGRFGNPASIDLFIRKEEDIKYRIDFVSQNFSGPFLLDFPFKQLELKEATLKYINEKKIQDRIIYNSINFATTPEELKLLSKYGINSAILLAVDMAHLSTDGSINLLEKTLLPNAKIAGIDKVLVDPGTMPFDNGNKSGEVLRSIMAIKSELGLPVGCAMINLVESWNYFKNKENEAHYLEALCSLNSSAQLVGADFLIYGPIEFAKNIFPSAAMMDKLTSEANENYFGIKPAPKIDKREDQ